MSYIAYKCINVAWIMNIVSLIKNIHKINGIGVEQINNIISKKCQISDN